MGVDGEIRQSLCAKWLDMRVENSIINSASFCVQFRLFVEIVGDFSSSSMRCR